ncbi:MAG: EscU/YscU/HrcU family type III secretion system export apparatus switch protein, partial [Candidatus Kryptoniota bacterium]
MAEETFQEKTEPATPKRLEELKSKGKVAKSRELTTASVLLVGTATIYMLGREFVMQIVQVMKDFLSFSYGREINQGNIVSLAATVVLRIVMITSPIILTIMVVGIISSVLQTGFIFTLQ